MDIVYTALLALGGFTLGAVPFSVLVGRRFLGKNIQEYGDGNPGSVNVFRAGGRKTGLLAVVLDIAKGVPFVWLAHSWLHLPELSIVIIAMSAVLGHSFSPFLHWHGGKSVAVTFGVLLGLPQHEVLLIFIIAFVVGFLLVENDAWVVVLGAAGTLAYLVLTGNPAWTILLMSCILALFIFKQFEGLHSLPRFHGRFIRWVQSIIHGSTPV
jgi:glycerol-3-phosphate acyltransferase PlsY